VLDHLVDTDEPQSIAQIVAGTGVDRNTIDHALFRLVGAEEIVGVDRGLAPPKPKPPPKPAGPPPPPPRVREGHTDDEWFALIAAYHATGQWDRVRDGLPPDIFGNRVPMDIIMRLNLRQEEAKKAAQKFAAQKAVAAAEDAALLKQLLDATNGNYVAGPDIYDLAPIKAALETVPIEYVLARVMGRGDKRIYPKNEAVRSWRDPALLRAIAEHFTKHVIVPRMVEHWSKAAPGAGAGRVEAPATVSAPPTPQ
jgi:hypothetical protein